VGNLERFGGAFRLDDLDTLPPFLYPFIFVAIYFFFLTRPPFFIPGGPPIPMPPPGAAGGGKGIGGALRIALRFGGGAFFLAGILFLLLWFIYAGDFTGVLGSVENGLCFLLASVSFFHRLEDLGPLFGERHRSMHLFQGLRQSSTLT
jgi:hypothetical protein